MVALKLHLFHFYFRDLRNQSNIFMFQHMIEHYRITYPDAFRLKSVDGILRKILDKILGLKAIPEKRNALQAVRSALADPL